MNLYAYLQKDSLSLLSGTRNLIEQTTGSENILNYRLINSAKFELTVWDLISVAIIIFVTLLVLNLVKKAFLSNKKIDLGKRYSLFNLTRYVIITIAFIWSLRSLGVNVTLLVGGSAALLVGVGMGLQNLFSDFVSGIILLIDSSIKVGDVIEVNGLVCQVSKIDLRTTQVLTRDDKYILLPNTQLTKNNIINWTHNTDNSRFDVSVGVDYSSDVDLVIKLMKEACEENEHVSKQPVPFVRFSNFGDSSLDFTVYFWARNLFRVENIKSEIRYAINKKFRENQVQIPFPQRVLHFKENDNNPSGFSVHQQLKNQENESQHPI